jgi:hypothetical protein
MAELIRRASKRPASIHGGYTMRAVFSVVMLLGLGLSASAKDDTDPFAPHTKHNTYGTTTYGTTNTNTVHVDSYTKKDGSFVQSHERTAPDATKDNNWSTKGNSNPYTGKNGTK